MNENVLRRFIEIRKLEQELKKETDRLIESHIKPIFSNIENKKQYREWRIKFNREYCDLCYKIDCNDDMIGSLPAFLDLAFIMKISSLLE